MTSACLECDAMCGTNLCFMNQIQRVFARLIGGLNQEE
jgi:hypothetical protein